MYIYIYMWVSPTKKGHQWWVQCKLCLASPTLPDAGAKDLSHAKSSPLYSYVLQKAGFGEAHLQKKQKNTFISGDKALYLPTIWVNIWKEKTWIKKQSNSHAKDSSFCGTQELLKYVAKDSLKSCSQQFARQIMLHDSSIKLYGQLHGC